MSSLNSNSISGITTTIFKNTHGVSKTYVDTYVPSSPSFGNSQDKVLVSKNGSSLSWNEISSSFEYSDVGISTFNVPSTATMFFIEAMGGGGGGGGAIGGLHPPVPTDWKLRTGLQDYYQYGPMNYGGGYFVYATQSSDRILASTDSITWKIRTVPLLNSGTFADYENGYFFGGGYQNLSVSTDSFTWILRTACAVFASGPFTDVFYDGYYYILLGGRQSDGEACITASTDTIHWVLRTYGLGSTSVYGQYAKTGAYAEVYDPAGGTSQKSNIYVIGTATGYVGTSTDGIVWTLRTSPGQNSISQIQGGKTLTYGNGSLYTPTLSNPGGTVTDAGKGFNPPELSGRCYGNGGLTFTPSPSVSYSSSVEVYDDNNVTKSRVNGGSYVQHTTNGWVTVASGSGTINNIEFLRTDNAASDAGFVAIRVDGLILQDSTRFILTGYARSLQASTDTIHWFLRTVSNRGYTSNLRSSAVNGNGSLWTVVGDTGHVDMSTDTITWERPANTTFGASDAFATAYGNGIFVWGGVQYKIESVIAGGSGQGGSGGNYASWYIPKTFVQSDTITIEVGSGGISGNTNNAVNPAGAGTTISWTSPDSNTCKITATGAGTTTTDSDCHTFGLGTLASADQTISTNQATGGGNGGLGEIGDAGGKIYNLGISIFAPADTDAPKVYGLPCGAGGGGGSVTSSGATYPSAWVTRTTGYTSAYTGVGYAFGLWTVFAGSDTYRTSTDGINWRARTTGSGAGTYNMSFGYNGSDLAILGQENGLLRSTTDAIHFTARTTGLGQSSNFTFAGYMNNLWFAAGQNGRMVVSTDAIHWNLRTTGSSNDVNQVAYGSANYILSDDNGRAASSTDTIHWISRTVSISSGGRLEGASHSSELGLYFISGRLSYSSPYNAADFGSSSTDTIHWTVRTLGIGDGYLPGRSIFADGIFTLVTDQGQGRLASSTDVIHWTLRTSNGKDARGIVRNSNGEYGIAGGTGFFSYLAPFPQIVNSGKDGFRGGGGGGGAASSDLIKIATGGKGGDGYAKITWY